MMAGHVLQVGLKPLSVTRLLTGMLSTCCAASLLVFSLLGFASLLRSVWMQELFGSSCFSCSTDRGAAASPALLTPEPAAL